MPKAKSTPDPDPASAEERITAIIAKFSDSQQKLIIAARKALRKRFPTANELVYDYARNFVIGYSPTHAGGEGIAALSADTESVRLYLTQGASLPDPNRILQGKAGARYMVLGSAKDIARPEVEALIVAAEKMAKVPLPVKGRGAVIIKPSGAEKKVKKKAAKR